MTNHEPASSDDPDGQAIMTALGVELRLAREALGLNRTEVVRSMTSGLSSQGLANYEYGIRPCTVVRLVQICRALNTPAMDLLGIALQRAGIDLYSNNLTVDLNALAEDTQPDLAPLHTWAKNRLAHDVDGSGIAQLSQRVVEEMAMMLSLDRTEFVRRLLAFTPSVAPRWWWPGTETDQ